MYYIVVNNTHKRNTKIVIYHITCTLYLGSFCLNDIPVGVLIITYDIVHATNMTNSVYTCIPCTYISSIQYNTQKLQWTGL